jgi:hypothetical protein
MSAANTFLSTVPDCLSTLTSGSCHKAFITTCQSSGKLQPYCPSLNSSATLKAQATTPLLVTSACPTLALKPLARWNPACPELQTICTGKGRYQSTKLGVGRLMGNQGWPVDHSASTAFTRFYTPREHHGSQKTLWQEMGAEEPNTRRAGGGGI